MNELLQQQQNSLSLPRVCVCSSAQKQLTNHYYCTMFNVLVHTQNWTKIYQLKIKSFAHGFKYGCEQVSQALANARIHT